MEVIKQSFAINYNYPVYFIDSLFEPANNHFIKIFDECGIPDGSRFLVVIDSNVAKAHPALIPSIDLFFRLHPYKLLNEPLVMDGGEVSKNSLKYSESIWQWVNKFGVDRHAYLIAIGGGALLDVVGFAAAVAHRGIRHIRIPTTVLSQNDSGVGVKNGINYFGKKNFLGTFSTPFAVINDGAFLNTLSDRDFRSGIAEAIKVALIKDAAFFDYLESNAQALNERKPEETFYMIKRCAQLHMQHIASADPFEQGSSRPLDYGHWSAHKLEQLSNFKILHGEAVAIGMCLDAVYAHQMQLLSATDLNRIISLVKSFGFDVYHKHLSDTDAVQLEILNGLNEFREHLGGKLTIMLLTQIGKGVEVNTMNADIISQSIDCLKGL
jgi:3-dehydroquinate synthase